MPDTGLVPTQHIEIFIGYENGVYRAEDGNGESTNSVECIGGRQGSEIIPTDVSWTIRNRTGHAITVTLQDFERDSGSNCPVIGGDIFACTFESNAIDHNGSLLVQTALNPNADVQRYRYDLIVKHATTGDGNIVDPELQIDNN